MIDLGHECGDGHWGGAGRCGGGTGGVGFGVGGSPGGGVGAASRGAKWGVSDFGWARRAAALNGAFWISGGRGKRRRWMGRCGGWRRGGKCGGRWIVECDGDDLSAGCGRAVVG
jgi:hypothetical protein